MSRSGSRYPSAYGHTPSYRSYYNTTTPSYPSALDPHLPSSSLTSSSLLRDPVGHYGVSSLDLNSFPSALSGGIGGGTGLSNNYSNSASESKVKSFSSSYSSTSVDGGRPIVEYNTDSTHRSSTLGSRGIPQTSYAHQSSNYSSENPYKNRTSSYSYNI